MRPGLWTRPLIARKDDSKGLLAPKIAGRSQQDDELILDPTIPENLARVKRNITLYKQWGYNMVKHDYSSWDIFGRWGIQMKDSFTVPELEVSGSDKNQCRDHQHTVPHYPGCRGRYVYHRL
jgi:alpha-galactosidase